MVICQDNNANYEGLDLLLPRPIPLQGKILVAANTYFSHNEEVFTPDCSCIQFSLIATA